MGGSNGNSDGVDLQPKIIVFGVGGAGSNAVNNMIDLGLDGVEFWVANTDSQSLDKSKCKNKIKIGSQLTRGLGAGSDPAVGQKAAEESESEIREAIAGCHMIFIAAGMGGGSGTGAAPVIGRIAKESGLLTVGMVGKPFLFEGGKRMQAAEKGLKFLAQNVDTLIVIPNQNLFRVASEKTTLGEAFKMADSILYIGVSAIVSLIRDPGLINLDFADIHKIMCDMGGEAMIGTGEAEGDNRAIRAAEAAISNPLLDNASMKGARAVLVNITGGSDLTLYEVDEAGSRVRDEVDPDAHIIFGAIYDSNAEGKIIVTVIATGIKSLSNVEEIQEKHQEKQMQKNDNKNKIDRRTDSKFMDKSDIYSKLNFSQIHKHSDDSIDMEDSASIIKNLSSTSHSSFQPRGSINSYRESYSAKSSQTERNATEKSINVGDGYGFEFPSSAVDRSHTIYSNRSAEEFDDDQEVSGVDSYHYQDNSSYVPYPSIVGAGRKIRAGGVSNMSPFTSRGGYHGNDDIDNSTEEKGNDNKIREQRGVMDVGVTAKSKSGFIIKGQSQNRYRREYEGDSQFNFDNNDASSGAKSIDDLSSYSTKNLQYGMEVENIMQSKVKADPRGAVGKNKKSSFLDKVFESKFNIFASRHGVGSNSPNKTEEQSELVDDEIPSISRKKIK